MPHTSGATYAVTATLVFRPLAPLQPFPSGLFPHDIGNRLILCGICISPMVRSFAAVFTVAHHLPSNQKGPPRKRNFPEARVKLCLYPV